jgi:hypothetical protein
MLQEARGLGNVDRVDEDQLDTGREVPCRPSGGGGRRFGEIHPHDNSVESGRNSLGHDAPGGGGAMSTAQRAPRSSAVETLPI